ncbi:putative beta-1,3-galactosyltransferase 12 [Citrus sinensis]|uniref:Beta-1,3-galactosyltransferase 12 n=1 Tax=Citrus sinensis TaxID=2711 RepID=A0ACB8NRJ4_CITSI|nr:putative beta-1,3-galactosyltransferase 12 [Citrus sinensis]
MVLRKGASASRCQYSLRSVASKKLYFETSGIKLEATTTNPFTNHIRRHFPCILLSIRLRDNGALLDRPKLLGFVGIQTGFASADRRAALRRTWFPSDPDGLLRLEQATGIAFRFVIGKSKDAKKMAQLEKEIDKLAYFRAAFLLFEAAYYVKADDDIYLRPDRLATLLAKERSNPLTCIGCMKKGHVITDPKMKWYEKSGHLIGNEYFLHAYGPIYVLSANVVASLAAARNNRYVLLFSLRMFSNEDVTIGSWMLAMNVHHEDNRAICDPRCTSTSIAVWDIPKCSEAMSSTKSIPFQYLIAALIAILKHFYGTEAINAFAEGAAGAGQFLNCYSPKLLSLSLRLSLPLRFTATITHTQPSAPTTLTVISLAATITEGSITYAQPSAPPKDKKGSLNKDECRHCR